MPSRARLLLCIAVAAACTCSGAAASASAAGVLAWGPHEALGIGLSEERAEVPVPASGITTAAVVAGGYTHALALLEDGEVRAWGSNASGQLGDGTHSLTPSLTPVEVSGLGGVTRIAAGQNFSLALREDGKVFSWGDAFEGQLGDGSKVAQDAPVEVTGLTGVTAIAAGERHGLALLADGTVVSWGDDSSGQLGHPPGTGEPATVGGLSSVKAISAGAAHALAVLEDGTVRAWGSNEHAALGSGGTEASSEIPVTVKGLSGITGVAGGDQFSLALREDGGVTAWGWARFGKLGDNTVTPSDSPPVTVCGASGVSAVAASQGSLGDAYAVGATQPLCASMLAISPSAAAPGEEVAIRGVNLEEVQSVHFGPASASFTVDSPTMLTAIVPKGAGAVTISVTSAVNTAATITEGKPASFLYQAVPEMGHCVKSIPGEYTNSVCTAAGSGHFEWAPLTGSGSFETAGATAISVEAAHGLKLTCTSEHGTGEYVGPRALAAVVLELRGCELLGSRCSSAGQAEGIVVTSTLDATLGLAELSKRKEETKNIPGLAFSPAGPEPFAQFTCGANGVVVRGGVVGKTAPDKPSAKPPVKFVQAHGKQKPAGLVGQPPDSLELSLNGGAYEAAGLAGVVNVVSLPSLEFNNVY